jgi:hypothetical protein
MSDGKKEVWVILYDVDYIGGWEDPSHDYSNLIWLGPGTFQSEQSALEFIAANGELFKKQIGAGEHFVNIRPTRLTPNVPKHEFKIHFPSVGGGKG